MRMENLVQYVGGLFSPEVRHQRDLRYTKANTQIEPRRDMKEMIKFGVKLK